MNANKRQSLAAQLVNVAARLKDADTIPGSAKFIGVLVGERPFGLGPIRITTEWL
jgi:hypothetical protein